MAASHKQLPLDQVIPGMVLSDQICNALGTVLLAQGSVVTEAILQSLHRHKIESLPILFEVTSEQNAAQELAEQLQRAQYLFRKHDLSNADDPNADASPHLFNLVKRYRHEVQS